MKIDPNEPVVDGVCFDDLHRLTQAQINAETERGRVFSTVLYLSGKTYGGNVIAGSYPVACKVAAARGLGEIVDPEPVLAAGRLETVL